MEKKDKIWNKDDQFKNQYSSSHQKEQIKKRWKYFKNIIISHNFDKLKSINVLDFGSGDGINILGIKKILEELGIKKYTLTATDINEDRLNKLTKKFPEVKTKVIDIVKYQLYYNLS